MSINKTSSNQEIKKLDESPTIADIVSIELLTPGSDECFISNPYKVDKVTIYSLGRNHFSGTPFVFEENHLSPKVLVEYEKAKAIACVYVKATGTVTISEEANLVASTHYIAITTTDGTVITATVTANGGATTTTNTNSPTWAIVNGSEASTAANLATCLNANSKLTATADSGVVTITQVDAGDAGNTTITLTDPDAAGMSKTDFIGGLPTKDQLKEVERLKTELNETTNKSSNYYSELVPVKVLGDENNPAWLSTDTDNAFIENVPLDADGNNQFGNFKYNWNPVQSREGDYIVCWTWTPNAAGDSISSFLKFNLEGSTVLTTSIPTHFTNPEKYTTLLERYLPDVYKSKLSEADVTPDTLDKFHKAIAKGFTFVEDMANQAVDLMDANSTHESLLNLLSNMFNLRLKSDDPTLWRRQIKTAVPLFKRKGTGGSLKEALIQADMELKKTTRLWQITSPYTWQESFKVAKDQTQFILEKVALGHTSDGVSAAGAVTISASQYLVATTHYITITTTDGTVITATASADATTATDTNSPTWELEGSDSWATGDNLATCLNANSKLTATSTHTGVVTITQADLGAAGNTTIVLTDPDGEGMTKTDFVNGTGEEDSGFVKRNMLAFSTTEVSSQSATGFNDNIIIYAPDVRFDLLPLDTSSNVLKILSPSVNAGNYSITSPDTHMANISGISEPLNTSSFTFVLSNDSYSGTAAIEQDDVFAFSDTTVDFIEKGVKTDWDDNNDSSYTGTAWKVQITESGFLNGIYTISNILSDGSLILNDPTEALPKSNSSSLSYNILDDSDNHVSSSANGSLAISRRAKITDSSPSGNAADNIRDVADTSDYFVLSGTEYKIIGFVDSQDYQFYISGYTAGDASGQSFNVYKRLVDSETGYVDYRGMKIVTSSNHESGLGIVNGSNPPATVVDDNLFKENFLVLIGSNYYKVTGIDGATINVDGPEESWKVSGGTSVTYSILKYSKENISIQPKAGYGGETEVDGLRYVQPANYQYLGHDFNFIDRRGNEVISLNIETAAPFAAFAAEALNATDNQIKEPISQEENITLEIEWADDEEIEGDNI